MAVINLRRRLRNEKIVPLRIGRVGHLEELRRRIARWIADHGEQIGAREPVMSDAINRAADNWFVLLAIADEAARHWPQRARDAATTLLASSDQASRLELLLGDIRDIAASPKVEQISSGLLVERLHKIEGRPWAEYGKTGKPLTQHQLARLLRDVGVAPEQITLWQVDDATGQHVEVQHRGYKLERFADAFARYLPAKERENADSGDSKVSKCQVRRKYGHF